MAVLLVRHAKAGDRERWEAPDHMRPLTTKGQGQAEGLVEALAAFEITRILSSPYLRCTQTVVPLAAARRLPVEPSDDLAEGAGPKAIGLVRTLLDHPADVVLGTHGDIVLGTHGDIVLCTHGDVVEEVLDDLGVNRPDWTKKGATWVLGRDDATHLPPPS